jgi:hypothetical protein
VQKQGSSPWPGKGAESIDIITAFPNAPVASFGSISAAGSGLKKRPERTLIVGLLAEPVGSFNLRNIVS